jgi:hypothetical protein
MLSYAGYLEDGERDAFVRAALENLGNREPREFRTGIGSVEHLITHTDLPPATKGDLFERLDRMRAER